MIAQLLDIKNEEEITDNEVLPLEIRQLKKYKRRAIALSNDTLYDRLSLAQKFSASRLNQYGFKLRFIRGKGLRTLAIFECKDNVATIDSAGEVQISPNIKLRMNPT